MNISLIVSTIIGFGFLIVAFIFEGGTPSGLLQPTAAMIVFGGTIGAVGVSFPFSQIAKLPKVFGVLLSNRKEDREKIIQDSVKLANMIKREGLLSLEAELSNGDYDDFMVRGLQMVTDGIEGELIRASLENRVDNMEHRHEKGIAVFESAGGYSPTMGVIGTVMGLINVLGNLGNPDELGAKIGVAFIATLYGVGMANLVYLPIATRLKQIDTEEIVTKSMIIEGVLLIYNGSNPTIIEERLRGFLSNEEEKAKESGE